MTLRLVVLFLPQALDCLCYVTQEVFVDPSRLLDLHLRFEGLPQLDVGLSDLIDLLLEYHLEYLDRRLIVGNGLVDGS